MTYVVQEKRGGIWVDLYDRRNRDPYYAKKIEAAHLSEIAQMLIEAEFNPQEVKEVQVVQRELVSNPQYKDTVV
jgi:hypothetical protein